MPIARDRFEIDPRTRQLANDMKTARETMETIVGETLHSAANGGPALESGRTVCGSLDNQRGPLARYPRAVSLSRCPVNRTGLWHTHPSRDELDSPSLSLPDMALVVFEGVDVHAVVGTQSGEIMVAPEDRDELKRRFNAALGIDASGPQDIVHAAKAGQLDPEEAGQRVRNEMPHLFERFTTALNVDAQEATMSALPAHAPLHACSHTHSTAPDAGRLRKRSRQCTRGLNAAAGEADINLRNLVVSQTVGTVVGNLANEFIVRRFLGVQ